MDLQDKQTTETTVDTVYEKPAIEIIEMETETSILVGSGGGDDFNPGGGWGN